MTALAALPTITVSTATPDVDFHGDASLGRFEAVAANEAVDIEF